VLEERLCIWCNTGWKVVVFDVMPVLFNFWKWDPWVGIGILKCAEKTIEIVVLDFFMGCGLEMWWRHHPCRQPCHHPRRQIRYRPCRQPHKQPQSCHHVGSHVIIHVAAIYDVYFRHRKWVWVGLWGPRGILWRFRNVMDQTIYDENLRNVTRCDLWHSIHDAIWDRHRYCFMTIF